MTFSPKSKIAFAAALAIAASSLISFSADAAQFRTDTQRPTIGGFAATPTTGGGGGTAARVPEDCNNVSSCNTMIAYCAGTGGDFEVRGSGPEGRPSHGTCSWPNS